MKCFHTQDISFLALLLCELLVVAETGTPEVFNESPRRKEENGVVVSFRARSKQNHKQNYFLMLMSDANNK